MYRFNANSRATISSTAIFLSQQSRQYFSSPLGSDTSFAPQSAQRDLAIDLRGIPQCTIYNSQCSRTWERSSIVDCRLSIVVVRLKIENRRLKIMDRPSHAGLRHLALNVRDMDAMKRFYVDVLGFAVEWEPDPDNVYLSSGPDNLALHRLTTPADRAAADTGVLDHLGLIVRAPDDV